MLLLFFTTLCTSRDGTVKIRFVISLRITRVFGGLCANMLLSKGMVTRWMEDIGGNVEL